MSKPNIPPNTHPSYNPMQGGMNRKQRRRMDREIHSQRCATCKTRLKKLKRIWILRGNFAGKNYLPFCSEECQKNYKPPEHKKYWEQEEVQTSPKI